MPNAFTLFGELKVDSKGFENSLHAAEVRLNQTERAIGQTEKRAQSLGRTNQSTARTYEKLNENVKANRDRMNSALEAYKRGEISQTRLASVLRRTDTQLTSLNSRLRDNAARLSDMPTRADRFANSLSRVNSYLVLAAGAVAGFAVKSALDLDKMRNRFTALEGSVGKANARIQTLLELSRKNVGVNFNDALENFAQLNSIGGISEKTIERMIASLGRLDTAFNIDSQSLFLRNLTQIFTQGFERADIKEAIGRVPIFEQIVEKAFGTKDAAKLKELKESGKLTLDAWMAGLGEAINTDTRLAGLRETISTKVSKMFTEFNVSAAPIVQNIFDNIQPEIDKGLQGLQNKDYNAVGQAIGTILGKAIGASLRSTLDAESAAVGGGGFADSLGQGILAGFNADSATTVVRTYFNKIGFEISAGILDLVALAYSSTAGVGGSLSDAILESLGFTVTPSTSANQQIKSYFRSTREDLAARYEDLAVGILQDSKASFQKVADDTSASEAVRANARNQVEKIGKEIEGAQKRLGDRLAASGAEEGKRAYTSVLHTVPDGESQIRESLVNTVNKATAGAVPNASSAGTSVGLAMAQGISAGLSSGQGGVVSTAIGMANAAWQAAKNALGIQSPSKVFFALGKDVAQGFIDGIASLKASVQSSMVALFDISALQGLSKKNDAEGVGFLTSLISEIARLNVVSKSQEVRLELTAGKYSKLNIEVKKRIELAAMEIDKHNAWAGVMDKVRDLMDDFTDGLIPAKTNVELLNDALAGPETVRQLSLIDTKYKNILLRVLGLAAVSKDILANPPGLGIEAPDNLFQGTGTGSSSFQGGDPEKELFADLLPPPVNHWDTFWGRIKAGFLDMQGVAASWKDNFNASLGGALQGIGGILADSVQTWDGTLGGFFKSVGMGFVDMAQQIISQLIQIAVYKTVLSFLGGIGGASGPAAAGANPSGISGFGIGGFASGGFPPVGQPSIVGERGPELFIPNTAGRIYSNSDSKKMLDGGNSGRPVTVINNFHSTKDGSFSKQSAEQAARAFTGSLGRFATKGNG